MLAPTLIASLVVLALPARAATPSTGRQAEAAPPLGAMSQSSTSTITSFCFGSGPAACPCNNAGLPGRGCENSMNQGGALLSTSGSTVPDTLRLMQGAMQGNSLAIFAQGDLELPGPVFFGDGLRCVGGTLLRLYASSAIGGATSVPPFGAPSISARSALLGDPLSPGDVRYYYAYYRDTVLSFCTGPQGSYFNVGNALRVVW
jgi:hypothetical protein